MRTLTRYLIVRADGAIRAVQKRPRDLRLDEVAYRVMIEVPEGWAQVRGDVRVTFPEPPEAVVEEHGT